MTLTESTWLASDNLPAMVQHLHDIGDTEALRAFVVECRVAIGMSYADATAELIYDRSAIWWARGDWICDWSGDNPQPDPRAAILHDVAGNPFRLVELPQYVFPSIVIATYLRENPHDAGAWAALCDSLQEAGCDNTEILNHCRGKGRCFSCLGDGYLDYPEEGQEPLTICLNCNGTGWIDLPKIGDGQHTENCHVLRLFAGV